MADTPQSGDAKSGDARSVAAIMILFAVIAVAVVSCVASNMGGGGGGSGDSGGMAEIMCEEYVTDQLTSPASAQFPGAESIEPLDNHQYRVTASVDSQNGYGALIHTDYVCTIQDSLDGGWRLMSLDLDG